MRRIEFIAPVEAMRGNLSGKQVLKYAENMNPAWDAPNGKQFAKNYRPRYLGAKRAASGLTYFATKVKSAVILNDAARRRQAALGCVASLISALKSEDCTAVIGGITYATPYSTVLKRAYDFMPEQNGVAPGETFEKWVSNIVYNMLYGKREYISVKFKLWEGDPSTMNALIYNPFAVETEITSAFFPWIAQRLYDKFIGYLAVSFVVLIDKQAFPFQEGDAWEDLITFSTQTGTTKNRATLLQRLSPDGESLLLDDLLVYSNNEEVAINAEINASNKYTTTAPAGA